MTTTRARARHRGLDQLFAMDTPFDYEHEHRCAEHEHGSGLSSIPISTAQTGQLLFERAQAICANPSFIGG